jgi:hypothetical protein
MVAAVCSPLEKDCYMNRFSFRRIFGLEQRHARRPQRWSHVRLCLEILESRIVPAVHDLTHNIGVNYPTIQLAVNAATAGDTLLADAGTYAESVTVNKSLTIEGNQHGVDARMRSGSESIVDGSSLGGRTVFNVTASDVTIDGFTLQGSTSSNVFGPAIFLNPGTSGSHIVNDIVQNNYAGLFLANSNPSDQTVVQFNRFQNNLSGLNTDIYADQYTAGVGGVKNVKIDSNTFTNTSAVEYSWALGISNTGTTPFTNLTFSNNAVTNHGRGAYFFGTSGATVSGNTITGTSHYAVGIFGSNGTPADSSISVTGNRFNINGSGGSGVEVVDDTLPGYAYTGTLTLSNNTYTISGTDLSIRNESVTRIDATGETFNTVVASSATTAQLFDVEHTIVDAIDVSGFGLVRLKAGNVYVTPNSFFAPSTTTPSIQRGIDAATTGDTVNVQAGTYHNHVVVSKSLTLKGANAGVSGSSVRGTESVVDGDFTDAPFDIAANNVVIDGFKIIDGQNGFNAGIATSSAIGGYTIANNVITNNTIGVYANSNSAATIQNNLFDANNLTGPAGGAGIYSDQGASSLTITGNEFKNHTQNNPIVLGATSTLSYTNLRVTNNSLHDNVTGIFALSINGGLFQGNTIRTSPAATALTFGGADTNISVVSNDLSNNARGLRIADYGYFGAAPNSNITVMCNNFANDSDFGLGVINVSGAPDFGNAIAYTGTLNAGQNWWGNVSGPTIAANPAGTGSKIRNDNAPGVVISFSPWATSAACTTFTAGPGVHVIGTQLFIGGGATSDDEVEISPVGSSRTGSTGVEVEARLNGVATEITYTQAFTAINIFLQNGDETVDLADSLTINTVVTAGNGNDHIELGNGNNTVTLGTGRDDIKAGNGTNTLTAGAAGSTNNIEVQLGNGANNRVTLLGNGNDQVQAGNGLHNTVMITGNGDDHVKLGDGNNDSVSITGNGDDHVEVGDGNHDSVSITGNGNDHVQVGDGNNDSVSITGNGNDQIQVGNGSGDSVWMVGNGNDSIQTGNGSGTVHVAGTGHKDLDLGTGWIRI